jgi:hypothetical protein
MERVRKRRIRKKFSDAREICIGGKDFFAGRRGGRMQTRVTTGPRTQNRREILPLRPAPAEMRRGRQTRAGLQYLRHGTQGRQDDGPRSADVTRPKGLRSVPTKSVGTGYVRCAQCGPELQDFRSKRQRRLRHAGRRARLLGLGRLGFGFVFLVLLPGPGFLLVGGEDGEDLGAGGLAD